MSDQQKIVKCIRTDLEAHAAECRKAMAAMRPRPDLPSDVGANLAGANLACADLAGADLAGAYLAGADLAGANLACADLARADLAGAYLAGANLPCADLARADLAGANLAGANLAGADLAGANLAGADLAGADLAGANLACADLARAYLAGAYLAGAKGIVDALTIGPIGSRRALLTAIKSDDGTVRVTTGCFYGTLEKFVAAVATQHGDNEHGHAYGLAVDLIRSRFGVQFPSVPVIRAAATEAGEGGA